MVRFEASSNLSVSARSEIKEVICRKFVFIAAGSSNGRTTVSGAVYRGSSPCPAAIGRPQTCETDRGLQNSHK